MFVVIQINEFVAQSRLAVNSVTLGNFEEPIRISLFVQNLFAGFSMVRTSTASK